VAELKGREIATKACKSISVDADRESNLNIVASKLCAAGQLMGDTDVILS
jgi:hypothetical protein